MKKSGIVGLMMVMGLSAGKVYGQEVTPLPGTESGTETTENMCAIAPTCESLGYMQTAKDCSGNENVLRCPLDVSKMFCLTSGSCGTEPPAVAVPGYILYADKTTNAEVVPGKAAVGVVFDAEKRLAVGLQRASNIYFVEQVKAEYVTDGVTEYVWEYPSVPSRGKCDICNNASLGDRYMLTETCLATCESQDGKSNTLNLVMQGLTQKLPVSAAIYTYTYQPTVCTQDWCKATNWFLPSLPEVYALYQNKEVVNKTLEKLGIAKLYFPKSTSAYDCRVYDNSVIYTSSGDYQKAFCVNSNNNPMWGDVKSYNGYKGKVYPVISF